MTHHHLLSGLAACLGRSLTLIGKRRSSGAWCGSWAPLQLLGSFDTPARPQQQIGELRALLHAQRRIGLGFPPNGVGEFRFAQFHSRGGDFWTVWAVVALVGAESCPRGVGGGCHRNSLGVP